MDVPVQLGDGTRGILSVCPDFKPGDQPPQGYSDWHEWARIQERGGLRQSYCGSCSKWLYPQEECGHDKAQRITSKEFNRLNREAERYVKKNFPSGEQKYLKQVREARARGELE